MNKGNWLKFISPAAPFIAVGVGVYLLHNGWVAFLIYQIAILCVIFIEGHHHVFKKMSIGWNWTAAGVSIFFCIMMFPLLYYLWGYMEVSQYSINDRLAWLGLEGMGWRVLIFCFVATNPILEEAFWRGYLDGEGKRPWLADAVFASYHLTVLILFVKWQWLILAFVILCSAGWGWRWLSRRLGGLAVPLVSHIIADICIVAAIQLIASRPPIQ